MGRLHIWSSKQVHWTLDNGHLTSGGLRTLSLQLSPIRHAALRQLELLTRRALFLGLSDLALSTGFWRAWTSLAASHERVTLQLVSNGLERFADTLASSISGLLRDMELASTVTADELGKLLAAGVQGLGLHLAAGVDPDDLEGAYAALWAGILGLTRPEGR